MTVVDTDFLIRIAIGLLWSIQTCGIGYILIFYLLHECYIASRLKLFGITTTGLITGTSFSHSDESGDEYFVHYKFSTNPPYPNPCWTSKIKISKSYYGECKKGETVRIIFDPITHNSDFYYDGYRKHICSKCDILCFCFIIPFPITSIFTAIYYSFNYNIISGISCIIFGLFISIPVCIYLCKRRNTFCYKFKFKHSSYNIGISKEKSLKDIKDTINKNHSFHSSQNSLNENDKILSIHIKKQKQNENENENKNEIEINESEMKSHNRINTYSGPMQLNHNNSSSFDINIPFETKTNNKINSKRRTNSEIITNNKYKYNSHKIYTQNNNNNDKKKIKIKKIYSIDDNNINNKINSESNENNFQRTSYDDNDIKMYKKKKKNTNNNPFVFDRNKKSQTSATTISNEPDISPYIVDDGTDSISADTSVLYKNTSINNKYYSYKTSYNYNYNIKKKKNNVITPLHIKYLKKNNQINNKKKKQKNKNGNINNGSNKIKMASV